MFDRMPARVRVPEGLADLPPGPALAAVLAGIDRSHLNGHDLVIVAQTQSRQVAHEQAQLLADLVAVAHCPPGDADSPVARTATIGEFAADELRAALTWTRRAAQAQLDLAYQVVQRLPAVHAALSAGLIDLSRARVLCDGVAVLDEPTARVVVDQTLDAAPGLTTGQLAARLAKLVIAIDPDVAQTRHDRGVAERRLVHQLEPDGTATILAFELPVARAAEAVERVAALATAARNRGDLRSLDQLRADMLLDLLTGTHPGVLPGPRRGVVELTVPLTTLIGLSQAPGEVAGWGPVIADIARQLAADQTGATWRFSVHDHGGVLLHHGFTRRRPTADVAAHVAARDRTCRAPGCRIPARRADLDHTNDHAWGGPTTPANLGALCRHDHRLKHEGGWRLRQPFPGIFAWTSALGHTYLVGPELTAQDRISQAVTLRTGKTVAVVTQAPRPP